MPARYNHSRGAEIEIKRRSAVCMKFNVASETLVPLRQIPRELRDDHGWAYTEVLARLFNDSTLNRPVHELVFGPLSKAFQGPLGLGDNRTRALLASSAGAFVHRCGNWGISVATSVTNVRSVHAADVSGARTDAAQVRWDCRAGSGLAVEPGETLVVPLDHY
jgi:hypothetical protein